VRSLELLGKIIESIFDSGRLGDHDWVKFSLVMMFNKKGDVSSTSGYMYEIDGKWHAMSVPPRPMRPKVEAFLNNLLKDSDVAKPKAMLLQFYRETGRVNTDLEYEDVSKWCWYH